MNFRDLKANEIDVRVGQVGDDYCTLLLYKDARVDMDILDETVGVENWQRKHYEVKDNMYCSVGINTNAPIESKEPRWVWKDDCGTESNTEKEKGEASDSFKRACVNWGIGRELYTSPLIRISCKTKDKKVVDLTNFVVSDIVIENKTITGLQIKAYSKENRTTDIVFTYGKCKGEKKDTKQPTTTTKKVEQTTPFPEVKKEQTMTLEEAKAYGFTSNGKDYYVGTMTDEQLLALKDYTKMPKLCEAVNLELADRAKKRNG